MAKRSRDNNYEWGWLKAKRERKRSSYHVNLFGFFEPYFIVVMIVVFKSKSFYIFLFQMVKSFFFYPSICSQRIVTSLCRAFSFFLGSSKELNTKIFHALWKICWNLLRTSLLVAHARKTPPIIVSTHALRFKFPSFIAWRHREKNFVLFFPLSQFLCRRNHRNGTSELNKI